MKCVCGYNGGDQHISRKPFIELTGIEQGPFHMRCQSNGFISTLVKCGTAIVAYACPKCGTVRIEA